MNKSFYITTPIYYVNDKPHIGHAYTTILADVIARFYRQLGYDTFFLTGLDEHGQKVQEAAINRKIEPQDHCDEMAPRFIDLWNKLHISNDDFIRTTEQRHKKVVQDFLQLVFDKGDIYKDEYTGLYSVSEERFITEKEAESDNFRDIKELKEINYFFKMSKFQAELVEYIENNKNFIQPIHRRNEILGFLKQPLADLCISRPKKRLNWGIELPFDTDYVTYVWFDALINYVTATGYGKDDNLYNKWWPANYHLIGKDILTTHAVYWPTMLLSAGIALPKTIFAHGWWLSESAKMSKSIGNVVNPLDLIEKYGVDPVRYYLMREMVLGQDANFTMESFIKRYNSDLANDFGNLLNRVSTLIKKNYEGIMPEQGSKMPEDEEVVESANQLVNNVDKKVKQMKINESIEEIMQFVRSINKYMEDQKPWALVKDNKSSAGRVLYIAGESIRIAAVLLSPVMPNRCAEVLYVFNSGRSTNWGELKSGSKLNDHKTLFPRIQ